MSEKQTPNQSEVDVVLKNRVELHDKAATDAGRLVITEEDLGLPEIRLNAQPAQQPSEESEPKFFQ